LIETAHGVTVLLVTHFMSEATVKTPLLDLYGKLGVRDAVGEAFKRGLLS